MAKVISGNTGKEVEIKDGDKIRDACEELGVPFCCREGVCGTCMIDITEGAENLSKVNEQEEWLGRDQKHRLACQCKIKKGQVKVKF